MSPINIQPPSPTALPCKVAELAKCAKKEFSPHFHLPNTYPWLPLYLCLYHRNTAHTELLPRGKQPLSAPPADALLSSHRCSSFCFHITVLPHCLFFLYSVPCCCLGGWVHCLPSHTHKKKPNPKPGKKQSYNVIWFHQISPSKQFWKTEEQCWDLESQVHIMPLTFQR